MKTKKMSLDSMHGKLSRVELKKFLAGKNDLVLCGGSGNHPLKCVCVGSTTPFYCCSNTSGTCVSQQGCSEHYVCSDL